MKLKVSKMFILKAILLFTFAGTSSAFAGSAGSITFSTGATTAIPTLSGTMLIVLSLLLFLVAFKVSKQKHTNASKIFVMFLGVSALGLGGGGIKLVNDVEAGASVPIMMEPVGPGVEPTDIVFAPDTTITTVRLENFVAFHFQNNLSPAQIIKVEAAGPEEGFICDYYSAIEPDGVLDCLTLPSLSSGEICGIGCRAIEGGPGSIPVDDVGIGLEVEALGKSNSKTWN